MSLQTGGTALGDTSTRSRFRSRAISSARGGGITPIISPFSSIKRISRARMRSLTRVSRERSFPRKSLLIGWTSLLLKNDKHLLLHALWSLIECSIHTLASQMIFNFLLAPPGEAPQAIASLPKPCDGLFPRRLPG